MSAENLELCCKTTYDAGTKTWHGIKVEPIYGPECSLGAAILEKLRKNSEKIFQFCHHNGKTYTNGDIARLSVQCAQHFKVLGVSQGEVITIVVFHNEFIAPLVFGAWLCGLAINPIEPTTDLAIIKKIKNKKELAMVFTIPSNYDGIKKFLDDLGVKKPIFLLTDNLEDYGDKRKITEFFQHEVDVETFQPEPLKHGCNQKAAILRSSGTTGTPKAICISHDALLNQFLLDREPDRLLGCYTIYWTVGLVWLVHSSLNSVPIVINETGYDETILAELIRKYKVTSMVLCNWVFTFLLEKENLNAADISSLRRILLTGCHVTKRLIDKAKTLMPNTVFYNLYGISEMLGLTIGRTNFAGDAGQLMPNCSLKVIDENGQNLGPAENGEICVRPSFLWLGYYDDAELTKTVYKDGWYHTNDLGHVDEQGNLHVRSRKKDVIQCNKITIYPNEIEKIIHELPGILEVSVCDIPDSEADFLLAAAVNKSENCDLTEEQICDYVSQRVSSEEQKLRGGVYFSDYIPKTSTGKIVRSRVGIICEYKRKMKLENDPDNMRMMY